MSVELQVDDFSPPSPTESALPDDQEMADEGGDNRIDPESSQPPCLMYAELVDVMERTAGKLQLLWRRVG